VKLNGRREEVERRVRDSVMLLVDGTVDVQKVGGLAIRGRITLQVLGWLAREGI
jgi:hypothetical protein